MAENTFITQTVQIGAEAEGSAGVVVAANKRLQSIMIEPKVDIDVAQFKPSGFKLPTIFAPTRDLTSGSFEAKGNYNELVYILGSAITKAVVATPGGGTLSRSWTYSPSAIANDNPRTYTIEIVSPERALRIPWLMFTGVNFEFEARGEVNLSGDFIGSAIVDDVTATASPTQLTMIPMLENQLDVYLDGTSGAIGTTKYLRVLKGSIEIGNRWVYLWTVNSAVQGPSAHLEPEPTVQVKLTLAVDDTGMALLPILRAGSTLFLRFVATGPVIEAAIPYSFTFDAPVKVLEFSEFRNEQELYAIEVTFGVVYDAAYGTYRAVVVNTLTGL